MNLAYSFQDAGAFIVFGVNLNEGTVRNSYISKSDMAAVTVITSDLIKIELVSRPSIYIPFHQIISPAYEYPWDFVADVQSWLDRCSCHGSGEGGGDGPPA